MNKAARYDVAIVGGGMVGAVAAVAPPRTARAVADRRGARIAVAAVATRMHHANRRLGAMVA